MQRGLVLLTVMALLGAAWTERTTATALWQALTLAPGDTAHVTCDGPALTVQQPSVTTANLACADLPSTPTPLPTLLPTPAPVLVEGVPLCRGHHPERWHPLVERDAAGAIACTYAHEHHDDPNVVNDLFGPPGAWFGREGMAISHVWETFPFTQGAESYPLAPPPDDQTVMENARKHNGYKWYVKRDLPCLPFGAPPHDGCFRAFRLQMHSLGTVHDSTARFHSFSLEALVDYHGAQGLVRGGGWLDTGHLGLLVNTGTRLYCPPLGTNPPRFRCPATGTAGRHRDAFSINVPAPFTPHQIPNAGANWYASNTSGLSFTPQVQDWGPVDGQNPHHQHYYPAHLHANNSQGGLGNVAAGLTQVHFNVLRQPDGRLHGVLYRNRHGAATTGCTAPGLDCIPIVVERAPQATYYMHIQAHGGDPTVWHFPDHDVRSDVTGGSLIQYPN